MQAPTQPIRVLELFSGIGGCAEALRRWCDRVEVVCAIDVSPVALEVYRDNFSHPTRTLLLDAVRASELAAFDADLWWLSPPCQPFTRRGLQRDDEDPRSRPLLRLLDSIATVRPRYLALENVPGFEGSRTHERLLETLDRAGYTIRQGLLCPSDLGIANRRQRFYLLASQTDSIPHDAEVNPSQPFSAHSMSTQEAGRRLSDIVQARWDLDPELRVDPEILRRYEGALHIVVPHDPDAVANCFTSAYGRSPVRSGSYLQLEDGAVRRFAATEIVHLLGFGPHFHWPDGMDASRAWRLAGNSLSVDAVQAVLAMIPELSQPAVSVQPASPAGQSSRFAKARATVLSTLTRA